MKDEVLCALVVLDDAALDEVNGGLKFSGVWGQLDVSSNGLNYQSPGGWFGASYTRRSDGFDGSVTTPLFDGTVSRTDRDDGSSLYSGGAELGGRLSGMGLSGTYDTNGALTGDAYLQLPIVRYGARFESDQDHSKLDQYAKVDINTPDSWTQFRLSIGGEVERNLVYHDKNSGDYWVNWPAMKGEIGDPSKISGDTYLKVDAFGRNLIDQQGEFKGDDLRLNPPQLPTDLSVFGRTPITPNETNPTAPAGNLDGWVTPEGRSITDPAPPGADLGLNDPNTTPAASPSQQPTGNLDGWTDPNGGSITDPAQNQQPTGNLDGWTDPNGGSITDPPQEQPPAPDPGSDGSDGSGDAAYDP